MYDIVCMHVRYAAYACMMYAGNRQDVGIHTSFSKRAHHCKGNSVQRSKQKKRAPVFSFAQLRAETCGNDAWEAPGKH